MRTARPDVGAGPSWGTGWDDVDPGERIHVWCYRKRCGYRTTITIARLSALYADAADKGLDRVVLLPF